MEKYNKEREEELKILKQKMEKKRLNDSESSNRKVEEKIDYKKEYEQIKENMTAQLS